MFLLKSIVSNKNDIQQNVCLMSIELDRNLKITNKFHNIPFQCRLVWHRKSSMFILLFICRFVNAVQYNIPGNVIRRVMCIFFILCHYSDLSWSKSFHCRQIIGHKLLFVTIRIKLRDFLFLLGIRLAEFIVIIISLGEINNQGTY